MKGFGVVQFLCALFVLQHLPHFTSCAHNATLTAAVTHLLNTILDKSNYDKNFRPGIGRYAAVVETDVDILSFGEISERNMELSITCYFRQWWVDDRLRFEPIGNITTLMLASKMLRDIWKPDTFIRNGRRSYIHQITVRNLMLRVSANGEVLISQRLTINARCPMHFGKFPMDTQACPLTIGSLGYDNANVIYRWRRKKGAPKVIGSVTAQYTVLDVVKRERNITDIRLPQESYYILQIYTPCTLIVVMSWVSFWINKEASPARVALGIMTVLSIATVGTGQREDLPRVSYSTAIDLYIVVCFGFVFAALVEYAVINFAHLVYIQKTVHQMQLFAGSVVMGAPQNRLADDELVEIEAKEKDERRRERGWKGAVLRWVPCRRSKKTKRHSMFFQMAVKAAKARKKLTMEDPGVVVDKIDHVSRFLFPGLYLLFNGLYWAAYLYWIPDEIEKLLIRQSGHAHGEY